MSKNTRTKTIFCDIDGCLIKHQGCMTDAISEKPEILPGVLDKVNEWDGLGYKIILTTGRKESARSQTEKQLREIGLSWDQLVMGLGGGDRILINDLKADGDGPTAIAINLVRNVGMENMSI